MKISSLIEKFKDRVSEFGIMPVNRQYELNTNYKPCSEVTMEFYIYPRLNDEEKKLFQDVGFYVGNSEWDEECDFVKIDLEM